VIVIYPGDATWEVRPMSALPVDPPPVDPPPVDPPPDPGAPLVWSRLDVGNTGVYGAYFRRPCVDRTTGDVWAAWGANGSVNNRGSTMFRQSSKAWALTSTTPGAEWDIGARENYGSSYDADRHCVWIGNGAPVSYGFPPAPPPHLQYGDLKFDISTNRYTLEYPVPDSMGKGDAPFLYWQGHLYMFGGWSNNQMQRMNIATGVKTNYSGTAPQFTRQSSYGSYQEEGSRLTYSRAGITPTGVIWALANSNEYWTWDCNTLGPWVKPATTGTVPPIITVVAALHEARNLIVAWAGNAGMTTGPLLGATWYLDLATLAWSEGPSLAAGDPTPLCKGSAGSNLLYDPVGTQCLLVVEADAAQVWSLK